MSETKYFSQKRGPIKIENEYHVSEIVKSLLFLHQNSVVWTGASFQLFLGGPKFFHIF